MDDVLRQRLERRGADPPDIIDTRMANARREMAQRGTYRHTVINDRLETAAETLEAIVRSYQK